ncbi:MAG: nucleoside triphosphate pyrophosphohydrolase [bacterium]
MSSQVEALLCTIHTLRSPGGCPWDRTQTLPNAAHYLLDEAGELLEAALAGDFECIREELGDLLFMICFCCEILGETQTIDLEAVARVGNEKLIRRHPHVFGDDTAADTSESQERWNETKAAEKRANGQADGPESILKDLPASSAPLHQSYTYQQDAARVGFDWPDLSGVWDKVHEELAELAEASVAKQADQVEHELGDLLFAVVNLARRLDVQPDLALRRANNRFRRRFGYVETRFGHDRQALKQASLEALEAAWQEAKALEEPGAAD